MKEKSPVKRIGRIAAAGLVVLATGCGAPASQNNENPDYSINRISANVLRITGKGNGFVAENNLRKGLSDLNEQCDIEGLGRDHDALEFVATTTQLKCPENVENMAPSKKKSTLRMETESSVFTQVSRQVIEVKARGFTWDLDNNRDKGLQDVAASCNIKDVEKYDSGTYFVVTKELDCLREVNK